MQGHDAERARVGEREWHVTPPRGTSRASPACSAPPATTASAWSSARCERLGHLGLAPPGGGAVTKGVVRAGASERVVTGRPLRRRPGRVVRTLRSHWSRSFTEFSKAALASCACACRSPLSRPFGSTTVSARNVCEALQRRRCGARCTERRTRAARGAVRGG